MSEVLQKLNIPNPPESLFSVENVYCDSIPAPELNIFTKETVLDENHFLFNLDHIHLSFARIGFIWTIAENSRHGRRIIGTCEIPQFKCGKWQKARQEQQIYEWFGFIPDFLITFDASFWISADPPEKLALFEHELYHAGQKRDMFGLPKFSRKSAKPRFALAGHSVEEHTGVVRRYGAEASGQDTVDFVKTALMEPEIAPAKLKGLCGVCV
jgi:hypothetical protein